MRSNPDIKSMLKSTMALALLAGTAYGQVPASNDTSDAHGNTGMGLNALGGPAALNAGSYNTASGQIALYSNTTGSYNTALGTAALYFNTTGSYNTASGEGSLVSNTTGNYNAASGYQALYTNTGDYNTATGASAMELNTSGYSNTAVGFQSLLSNTGGYSNTASGVNALYSNTTGIRNTASGQDALFSNTTGGNNTAFGVQALAAATSVDGNTAIGFQALAAASTSNNIALGFQAGANVTTGSSNIEIGNVGAAADNKVIKIGTEGTHKKTLIAGIYGNTAVSGLAVVIGSTGELGVVSSSERFKTAIAPMGSDTEKLQRLRPVTFHYRTDPKGTLRYGLIAEEVAKVYPELVVRNEKGRIDGVRYDELAPMLLNAVQQQAARIASLEQKAAEVDDLKQQLAVVIQELKAREQLVAQR